VEKVATSFNFNGSKWFLCGFDSAFLWIKDRNKQMYAFSAGGEYLAPDKNTGVYDPEFKDWAVRGREEGSRWGAETTLRVCCVPCAVNGALR
jgi:hypothetical protein